MATTTPEAGSFTLRDGWALVSRLTGAPGYYLALSLALGLVAIAAASLGMAGLALFAGAHMLLGLVAAGWRVQEAGGLAPAPTRERRERSARIASTPEARRV